MTRPRKRQIFVSFSTQEKGKRITVAGHALTKPVVDKLRELFPENFTYLKDTDPMTDEITYRISSILAENQLLDFNENVIDAPLLIKVLTGLELIKLSLEFRTFIEPRRGEMMINLIDGVIKDTSQDENLSLNHICNLYKEFVKFADDVYHIKKDLHYILTENQQEQLKNIFSNLFFYKFKTNNNKQIDSYNYLVNKTEENALSFEKIPYTLAFLQKIARVEEIQKTMTDSIQKMQLAEMCTAFSLLAKAVADHDDFSLKKMEAVYQHYEEALDAVIDKRPLNLKKLTQTECAMNEAFHGAPPLNKTSSMALSAVKSAVTGLVVTFVFLSLVATVVATGGASLVPIVLGALGGGGVGAAFGLLKTRRKLNTEKNNYYVTKNQQLPGAYKSVYEGATNSMNTFFSSTLRSKSLPKTVVGTENRSQLVVTV